MIVMDTHTWWWAISEPDRLSKRAFSLIKDTPPAHRSISAVSIWEFAMMSIRGRIELKGSPKPWIDQALAKIGTQVVHISADIALDACTLPGDFHKDPFDRMIVATARHHSCVLVTADKKILSYPNVNSAW